MKALLVARVSRGERSQDPESQLVPLRAAAAGHGFDVAGEVPLTLSAWDDTEAARVWATVTRRLAETGARVVMVWALDRLCRGGIEDAFAKVRHLERHLGVQFWSHQESFLSTAGTDPQQRELMLALMAWAAKWESQRKSDRLRAKVAQKKQAAANGGGRARWGRGVMPTEADRQQALELKARGATVRAIGLALSLSPSTVSRLCANPPPPTAPPTSGQPTRPTSASGETPTNTP